MIGTGGVGGSGIDPRSGLMKRAGGVVDSVAFFGGVEELAQAEVEVQEVAAAGLVSAEPAPASVSSEFSSLKCPPEVYSAYFRQDPRGRGSAMYLNASSSDREVGVLSANDTDPKKPDGKREWEGVQVDSPAVSPVGSDDEVVPCDSKRVRVIPGATCLGGGSSQAGGCQHVKSDEDVKNDIGLAVGCNFEQYSLLEKSEDQWAVLEKFQSVNPDLWEFVDIAPSGLYQRIVADPECYPLELFNNLDSYISYMNLILKGFREFQEPYSDGFKSWFSTCDSSVVNGSVDECFNQWVVDHLGEHCRECLSLRYAYQDSQELFVQKKDEQVFLLLLHMRHLKKKGFGYVFKNSNAKQLESLDLLLQGKVLKEATVLEYLSPVKVEIRDSERGQAYWKVLSCTR